MAIRSAPLLSGILASLAISVETLTSEPFVLLMKFFVVSARRDKILAPLAVLFRMV